jgi:hypothetical protein
MVVQRGSFDFFVGWLYIFKIPQTKYMNSYNIVDVGGRVFFGICLYILIFFNTQTIQSKSVIHNSIALFPLKTFYPGGNRTRVCSSSGGCHVYCATPPRPDVGNTYARNLLDFWSLFQMKDVQMFPLQSSFTQ